VHCHVLSIKYLCFQTANSLSYYFALYKGVRKGVLGLNPPLSLIFYKIFITFARRLSVFAYFLLVNLSTECTYHGINLHANFKDHCKWAKKVIIRFWWKSGLSSPSRNHPTAFCRPFVHHRSCSATVHFVRNHCLYIVCQGRTQGWWMGLTPV